MSAIQLAEENVKLRGLWTIEEFEGELRFKNHWLVNLLGTRLYTRLFGQVKILNKKLFEVSGENLITTVGKGLILDRIFGLSSVPAIAGLAVGTSATAAAVGNTAITGEVYKAFEATPTRSSLTVTGSVLYGTAEANITIQEAGALTGPAGTLLNRIAPIGPFTKTSATSIRVTLQLTQA